MAANESMKVIQNEVVRRVAVSSIARLDAFLGNRIPEITNPENNKGKEGYGYRSFMNAMRPDEFPN